MRISVELNAKETAKGRQVQLVFVQAGRVRMGIPVHVQAKDWDTKKAKVKFGAANAALINARIAAQVQQAERIVLERNGITPQQLKAAMQAEQGGTEFGKLAMGRLKPGTINFHTRKQRISTLNRFLEWAGPVALEDIDRRMMADYREIILGRGNKANTVAVQLKRISIMYKMACKDAGIDARNILEGCDATERYTEPPSRFTGEEVVRLMDFADNRKGWNAKAVHMWLFSFFCAGIRWGDMCRLRTSNIVDGRLVMKQHKTGAVKDLALLPYALGLTERYRVGEYLFGINGGKEPQENKIGSANVQANRALKRAAKACGIAKRMHTHNARHSFAAQALEAAMDDRAIQTAMGISDEVYKHYRGRIRPETVDAELRSVLGTLADQAPMA